MNTFPLLLRERALQIFIDQIGVEEVPRGSNKGPKIKMYLNSVGLNEGYPWCQACLYWCFDTAAKDKNVINPVYKTASVLKCWANTPVNARIARKDAISRPASILQGYQFFLKEGLSTGHTGIVESVDITAGIIHTIEGNTNNDGSREGYGVFRHTRKLAELDLLGFAIY